MCIYSRSCRASYPTGDRLFSSFGPPSLVSKLKATKTRMKIRNRRTVGPASGGGFPTCI